MPYFSKLLNQKITPSAKEVGFLTTIKLLMSADIILILVKRKILKMD